MIFPAINLRFLGRFLREFPAVGWGWDYPLRLGSRTRTGSRVGWVGEWIEWRWGICTQNYMISCICVCVFLKYSVYITTYMIYIYIDIYIYSIMYVCYIHLRGSVSCVYTVYTHIRFISLPLLNTNDIQEPCCHVLYEWVHGPVTPKWMVIFICRSGDFIVLKHLYIVRRILYIVLIAKICLTEPNIIKRPRHPLMLYIYIYIYIIHI